jgi:hypothetical protein
MDSVRVVLPGAGLARTVQCRLPPGWRSPAPVLDLCAASSLYFRHA